MGRNHEVTTKQYLLDQNGELREPGWSRTMVQRYRRSDIKAPKLRIKEWDYYLVLGERFAGAFTISDDGYIGLHSVSLLRFGSRSTNIQRRPSMSLSLVVAFGDISSLPLCERE